jgi:hypothetical protein
MSLTDAQLDDLLRRVPAPPLAAESSERLLDELLLRLDADLLAAERTAAPSAPARRGWRVGRRPRRVAVVAAAAAVLVGLGGTAVAMLAFEHAPVRDLAHCFPYATTDVDRPGLGPDVTLAGGADSAAQALDLCRAEWRSGALVATPPYVGTPGGTPQPVPPLVACVLPTGVVGVFPGPPETCTRLGFPRSDG